MGCISAIIDFDVYWTLWAFTVDVPLMKYERSISSAYFYEQLSDLEISDCPSLSPIYPVNVSLSVSFRWCIWGGSDVVAVGDRPWGKNADLKLVLITIIVSNCEKLLKYKMRLVGLPQWELLYTKTKHMSLITTKQGLIIPDTYLLTTTLLSHEIIGQIQVDVQI